jgi:hypothetical protein
MPIEIILVRAIKALAELGGLFLLGQGALYVLAGAKREQNFMYQLFGILTKPVFRLARAITPKVIDDRHMPIAAFMLMFWIWAFAILALGQLCAGSDVPGCKG